MLSMDRAQKQKEGALMMATMECDGTEPMSPNDTRYTNMHTPHTHTHILQQTHTHTRQPTHSSAALENKRLQRVYREFPPGALRTQEPQTALAGSLRQTHVRSRARIQDVLCAKAKLSEPAKDRKSVV